MKIVHVQVSANVSLIFRQLRVVGVSNQSDSSEIVKDDISSILTYLLASADTDF